METLNKVPIRTLQQCEADIEHGSAAFLKVGKALLDIESGKLYQDDKYESFEDYCRKRWGFSRSTGTTTAMLPSLTRL